MDDKFPRIPRFYIVLVSRRSRSLTWTGVCTMRAENLLVDLADHAVLYSSMYGTVILKA